MVMPKSEALSRPPSCNQVTQDYDSLRNPLLTSIFSQWHDMMRRINILADAARFVRSPLALAALLVSGSSKRRVAFSNGMRLYVASSELFVLMRIIRAMASLRRREIKFHVNDGIGFVQVNLNSPIDFTISSLSNLELLNLLELFYYGAVFGSHIVPSRSAKQSPFFARTLSIDFDTKIVSTPEGIRFRLGGIQAYTIVETFFLHLHDFLSDNAEGKTILDVGAQAGDTALLFADKGATVWCLEPVSMNYEALLKNIELNPGLAARIHPIKGGLGCQGTIDLPVRKGIIDGGASIYQSRDFTSRESVAFFQLEALLRTLGLDEVDRMKLDCRGCEMELKASDFRRVRELLKIEYLAKSDLERERVLEEIKQAGFSVAIITLNPLYRDSPSRASTLYARRDR